MKTILFDLDGTLIDSTQSILGGFETAYRTFHRPTPKADEITRLIGYPLDIMFSKLGIQSTEVWQYVQAYKEHYRVISKEQTTLLPFAKEAIEHAFTFANLGVVTTKTAHYSQDLLEHFGVMNYFKVLIGRESITHPKPHPEPILKALSTLNANPENTWMIGDTKLDLIAAKEANVHGVGVLCGYGHRDELMQYTSLVCANAKEAVAMIALN